MDREVWEGEQKEEVFEMSKSCLFLLPHMSCCIFASVLVQWHGGSSSFKKGCQGFTPWLTVLCLAGWILTVLSLVGWHRVFASLVFRHDC